MPRQRSVRIRAPRSQRSSIAVKRPSTKSSWALGDGDDRLPGSGSRSLRRQALGSTEHRPVPRLRAAPPAEHERVPTTHRAARPLRSASPALRAHRRGSAPRTRRPGTDRPPASPLGGALTGFDPKPECCRPREPRSRPKWRSAARERGSWASVAASAARLLAGKRSPWAASNGRAPRFPSATWPLTRYCSAARRRSASASTGSSFAALAAASNAAAACGPRPAFASASASRASVSSRFAPAGS